MRAKDHVTFESSVNSATTAIDTLFPVTYYVEGLGAGPSVEQ